MQDSRLFYSHPATAIKRRVIGATGRRTYNANSTLSGELRKPNLKHTIRRSSRVRIASHLGPRLTTFRINTCQSVSKQSTLTTFRINTCEKPRGRGLVARPVGQPFWAVLDISGIEAEEREDLTCL